MGWLRRLFGLERPTVVYPYAPLLEAMHAKDPELFMAVGPLSPPVAVAKWREKYPEDFGAVKRSCDFEDEARAVDFLAKTVLEEVEFTDTGCVDTEGNKVVVAKSLIAPIGYVRFRSA